MKRLALVAALLTAVVLPAKADFLFGGVNFIPDATEAPDALSVGGPIPAGNQPQNIVCIICGTNQPQQDSTGAGPFPYNNYQQSGNIVQFLAASTATFGANGKGDQLDNNTLGTGYLRTLLLAFAAAGGGLNVGIDVNTAQGQGPEILNRFAVVDLGNHTLLADTGPISMALPTLNNGSGFPDYTISGFNIDRSDINAQTQIAFLASWSNASDGAESFFLVPAAAAVPGPIVGAGIPGLIAAAFGMLGFNRFRRKRRAA